MSLEIRLAYDTPETVQQLVEEYCEGIMSADDQVKAILEAQNYRAEFAHLLKKYALPEGRMYLAFWDGMPAGCAALRKLDDEHCEMKRLYVRSEFRGHHIGEALIRQLISDAAVIGYRYMRLDTLPYMQSALHLYRKAGFYDIPAYYDTPDKRTIFLQLDLSADQQK